MNKLLFTAVAAAAMILSSAGTVTVAVPASKNTAAGEQAHPRLVLRAGQEKELLKKIKKDPLWNKVHRRLLDECDRMDTMQVTEVKFDQNHKTMLSSAREMQRKMMFLSYAYRMTGNKSYLRRAEQEMLYAAGLENWNDKTFLDAAEITLGMAIGYDWLYDQLSPQSRSKIAEAIINFGLKPSVEKPQFWPTSVNNWNQVCNAAMVCGAIATKDVNPELAKQIMDRAETSLPLAMGNYGPDGAYPEGPMYWEYGTQFNALYLSAYENYFGKESELVKIPGFMKTGLYYSSMITPTLNRFNYCDCSSVNSVSLSPSIMWFYGKTKNPALLFFQHTAMNAPRAKFEKDRFLPFTIIWGAGAEAPMAKAVNPDELMYVAQGVSAVAAMRSSWVDPNALYVGVKAGSPNTGHGHMDVGSFIFEANGERWATDLGPERYHTLETYLKTLTWSMKQDSPRWDVFRYSNRAHNTLMINDAKQLVSGKTIINEHSDNPDLMYTVVDLSSIYADQVEKVVRGVAMVNKQYVMIEDVITTGDKPAKIHWNMTVPTTNVRVNQEESSMILFKNKKRVDIKVEAEGAQLAKWSAKPTDYDPAKSYEMPNNGHVLMGFEVTIPANTTRRLKVYLMPSNSSAKEFKVDNPLKQIVK